MSTNSIKTDTIDTKKNSIYAKDKMCFECLGKGVKMPKWMEANNIKIQHSAVASLLMCMRCKGTGKAPHNCIF